MLPPGQAEVALELDRGPGLEAVRPVGVAQQDVLDRLGQHGVQRLAGCALRARSWSHVVVVLAEQPRRQVQPEERQRLRLASRPGRLRGSSGRRGCGSRSRTAADPRHVPGRGRGIRLLQLAGSPR